jgi:uncharacterized protein YceH (UPF0502 family)
VKYRHLLDEAMELDPPSMALLCVLMLRGPQTAGELKQRSERLHPFASLDEIVETLDALGSRGLAVRLSRRPGQKEERYAHLLGGDPDDQSAAEGPNVAPAAAPSAEPADSRLAVVEERLARLEQEVAALRQRLPSP